jgi:hypothetical protein
MFLEHFMKVAALRTNFKTLGKPRRIQEPIRPATIRGQNQLTGSPEMETFGKPLRRFGAFRQKAPSLVSRTAAMGGRR